MINLFLQYVWLAILMVIGPMILMGILPLNIACSLTYIWLPGKGKKTMLRSSTKTKYHARAHACCESQWVSLSELGMIVNIHHTRSLDV